MPRVLIIATSRKTRGGITAVIKAHEQGKQWQKYRCTWIQTHRDGPVFRKLLYLIIAWFQYIILLPFSDIVHIHFSLKLSARRKLPFAKLAHILHKKIIVHLHCGSQIDDIWNKDYNYLFSCANIVLVLSKSIKETVEKHIGETHDVRVCYNPCPEIVDQDADTQKKYILFSGTLYKGKGYQDLIYAFSKISDIFPDWKIVFAGNGEVEEAKSIACESKILDKCIFLGWVDGEKKNKAFKEASIFCLPSYAEGFPMAVLDAFAYGLPVITTPVGGIPDIAKDGENMLLFNPGDVDTLARQIEKLMSDSDLRKKLSESSVDLAETTFNINRINGQIEDLYDELIAAHNKFGEP